MLKKTEQNPTKNPYTNLNPTCLHQPQPHMPTPNLTTKNSTSHYTTLNHTVPRYHFYTLYPSTPLVPLTVTLCLPHTPRLIHSAFHTPHVLYTLPSINPTFREEVIKSCIRRSSTEVRVTASSDVRVVAE